MERAQRGLRGGGQVTLVVISSANALGRTRAAVGNVGGASKSVAEGKITGYRRHGLNQAISREGRGVSTRAILDAVKNPTKVVQQSGGKIKFVGKNATVITNAHGEVRTTWSHSSAGFRVPNGGQ